MNNGVCGIAILDAEVSRDCPFYQAWSSMIKRCYSKKVHERYPTYIGCSVSSEWLTFSNFKIWMMGQEWLGMQLDKDILSRGNKIYSKENCCFVKPSLNYFLVNCEGNGELPPGCYWNAQKGKYQSQCRNPFTGKREHLGYFDSPNQAGQAWQKRKHEHACAYAKNQSDERVSKALLSRFKTQEQAQCLN